VVSIALTAEKVLFIRTPCPSSSVAVAGSVVLVTPQHATSRSTKTSPLSGQAADAAGLRRKRNRRWWVKWLRCPPGPASVRRRSDLSDDARNRPRLNFHAAASASLSKEGPSQASYPIVPIGSQHHPTMRPPRRTNPTAQVAMLRSAIGSLLRDGALASSLVQQPSYHISAG